MQKKFLRFVRLWREIFAEEAEFVQGTKSFAGLKTFPVCGMSGKTAIDEPCGFVL